MAVVRPFRAIHYNPDKVKLEDAIAPPYDVISRTHQGELFRRDPHNVVRLILGNGLPSEIEGNDWYERAYHFLEKWRGEKVLVQDARPAFYLLAQNFRNPETEEDLERKALLGLLRLEPFVKKVVLPHERTHSLPKMDRLNLIRSVRANFSSIFCLYEDTGAVLARIFELYRGHRPWVRVRDDQGVLHTVWRVSDASAVKSIQHTFQRKTLLIADGHHRYETALTYAEERRQYGDGSLAPHDFVLVSLVNVEDAGLLVFPTHRVVHGVAHFSSEKFLEALETHFRLKRCKPNELVAQLHQVSEKVRAFGVYVGHNQVFLATLADAKAYARVMPRAKPRAWRDLDLACLEVIVLRMILGIEEEKLEQKLFYTRSLREALAKVDAGEGQAALIVRPTPVRLVKALARARELMPQKSTYFYPKFPSGLLVYSHEA